MINLLMKPLIKSKIVIESFASTKGYFMLPIALSVTAVRLEWALLLLFGLMTVDFGTGVGASHFERKKLKKENPDVKHGNLISSEELKKSGVKFTLYAMTILLAYFLEQIFFVKSFQFGFSEAKFSISIVVIGFWCIVEFYSIVFENFKRMGVDVVEKFKNIVSKYKTTKKDISDL